MMSSNWYEVVLDKFGTIENFVDRICEVKGLTEEEVVYLLCNTLINQNIIQDEVKVTINGVDCGSIWV